MILREVRFRATCRCVQRCTPRRSPPIWFEHDAELTVATLALSRRRVLLVKRASVPPRQGIDGLCPCPMNQNDYRLCSTNVDNAMRALAHRGRMWKICRDGADDPAISRSPPSHDGTARCRI